MLYAGVEDRGNFSGARSPLSTLVLEIQIRLSGQEQVPLPTDPISPAPLGNSSLPKIKTELVSIATNSSILGVLNKLMRYEPCLVSCYTYGQGYLLEKLLRCRRPEEEGGGSGEQLTVTEPQWGWVRGCRWTRWSFVADFGSLAEAGTKAGVTCLHAMFAAATSIHTGKAVESACVQPWMGTL